jgi:sulfonate transport system permease protein
MLMLPPRSPNSSIGNSLANYQPADRAPAALRLPSLARRAAESPLWRLPTRWLLGFLVPLLLTLGWEAAVALGWNDGRLLPPPSRVLATFANLARSGELTTHIEATLARVAWGFLLGVVAGTALGALTGTSALARRLLDPTLQALRSIPSIAWVPLFILWFGIFETSKVLLIAAGVFFPIYLSLSAAILGLDRKLVEVGRIFRLSRAAMIWRVFLPATLPAYFIALRNGLGLGWMFVVAAEFMGASSGLGFLLTDGQMTGNTPVILASIVAFAILGKLTDWGIVSVGRHVLRWQDTVARPR